MPSVPIYVKGGLWTNLEDQILKAAVQKYGTHSWNKVASLLQKKNGKQCKNRWSEFLNPRLNFDTWSSDEDSRLLQLAKQLPNQWRSIGELMGRTPQVCIDRYHKLLDGELDESNETWKAGDFNPAADTQPARPEEGRLEEDEREMLAEARARLLNTQGKKATRKIRERMLEESNRVAYLQKRRELKQAGVDSKIKPMKKKYSTQIDYNADIAYEQEPREGVYDITEEDNREKLRLETFEQQVGKKGLSGTERGKGKDKAKKRQREEQKDTVTALDATTNNECKKPKLVLPAPGTSTANKGVEIETLKNEILEQMQRGSIMNVGTSAAQLQTAAGHDSRDSRPPRPSRRVLARLFAALPKPKNDFEIVFEDDPSSANIADGALSGIELTATVEEGTPGADDNSVMLVPWPCPSCERSDLPVPPVVDEPSNDIDRMLNSHILARKTGSQIYETPDMLGYANDVERLIESNVDAEKLLHPAVRTLLERAPATSSLEAKIQTLHNNTLSRTHNLQLPVAVKDSAESSSRRLHRELLPALRTDRLRYYTQYKKYEDEYYAIHHRKLRLNNDLT